MRARISAAIAALSTPGAMTLSSLRPRRRFCRSAWIASAMPGYWTLTATSRPSRSVARCTWPIDAAAIGSSPKSANSRDIRSPRSSSTTPRIALNETGSAPSCSWARIAWNSGRMSSGTRPRSTADSVWPTFIAAPRIPEKTFTSAFAVFSRWRSPASLPSTRAAASRVATPAAAPVSLRARPTRDPLIWSSLPICPPLRRSRDRRGRNSSMVDHVIDERRMTRAEQRVATRSAILDAAGRCLVDDGYAGLTTRRIADRADVAQSTLMHHFPTREALLVEAVQHLALRLTDTALEDVDLSTARMPELLDRVWAVFTSPESLAAAQLWFAASTEPDLAAALHDLEERLAELVLAAATAVVGDLVERSDFEALMLTGLA